MFKKKNEVKQEEIKTPVESVDTEEYEEKGSIVNSIVNGFLVFAIILAAICTYVSFVSSSGNGVPSILGIRPFSIQTESMYPTLEPGDLIISTSVEPEELRIDDIITYWTVINGERVLNTHRISDIYDGGTHLIFATKGDNNTTADSMTVHASEIVGIYRFRIPGVGKVFDFLQTSTGFFLIIVLPVFMFFIYHLVQFFKVLFEYQNIKNRIKYEQEREITEDLIAQQKKMSEENSKYDRAEYEKELREKLKAEILAEEAKKREKEALEAKIREELKAEMLAELKTKKESAEPIEEAVEVAKETVEVAKPTETAEVIEEVVEADEETVELAEPTETAKAIEEVVELAQETEEVAEPTETAEVIEEVVEVAEETVELAEPTETAGAIEEVVESVEETEEVAEPTTEIAEPVEEEVALREKMIEEELKKREAAMLEKLREELKAQLLAEMTAKEKDTE